MDVTIAFWQFLIIIVGMAGIWASTRKLNIKDEQKKEETIFSEMSPEDAFDAMRKFGRASGYLSEFFDQTSKTMVFDAEDRSPIGVVFAVTIAASGKNSLVTIAAYPKVPHMMPAMLGVVTHFIDGAKGVLQQSQAQGSAVTEPAPH